MASVRDVLATCRTTSDIDEILSLTRHDNADVRLEAVRQLCPCRVKKDIDVFWARVLRMADDADPRVRYQVLHIMCDGAPPHLEDAIIDVIRLKFNRDEDRKIRRQAHKVLGTYDRTGKWNIM